MAPRTALLVTAHGTVASLDELPAFLQVIRRGRPAPDELVREVRRRYEAIGGRSPLTDITARQAEKTGALLGLRSYMAMRLWSPLIRPALERALADGAERILSLPAAPFSVDVYHEPVAQTLRELAGESVSLVRVGGYGTRPAFVRALADRVREAQSGFAGSKPHVLFTAHSLPTRVVAMGDRYPTLVSACADAVARELGLSSEDFTLGYQSQGASEGPWLGPDLAQCFDALCERGVTEVILSPIGFLTDHVEVLYDLDIEAAQWARERGITTARARALNADDDLCEALAEACREALLAADAR
jgi:ferrochelatase